jgi:Putative zinc-finger
MSACNRYRDWMVESLYGELDGARQAEFGAHVGGCAACAKLAEEMRATLSMMSARRRPDPGAEYWDTYWERLERRLAREDSGARDASRPERRQLFGSWGFRVAAAVLILAAGVWIGRSVLAPGPSPPAGTSSTGDLADASQMPADTTVQNRTDSTPAVPVPGGTAPAIDAPAGEQSARGTTAPAPAELAATNNDAALRYIERSQVVLLALLNADPGDNYAAEVGSGRARAGELLVEGREVRKSLSRDDRRLRELVDQLDLILREIAHLEADADLESVDVIRGRLAREGVLLRINLEQMRESGAPGSPAPKADAID